MKKENLSNYLLIFSYSRNWTVIASSDLSIKKTDIAKPSGATCKLHERLSKLLLVSFFIWYHRPCRGSKQNCWMIIRYMQPSVKLSIQKLLGILATSLTCSVNSTMSYCLLVLTCSLEIRSLSHMAASNVLWSQGQSSLEKSFFTLCVSFRAHLTAVIKI